MFVIVSYAHSKSIGYIPQMDGTYSLTIWQMGLKWQTRKIHFGIVRFGWYWLAAAPIIIIMGNEANKPQQQRQTLRRRAGYTNRSIDEQPRKTNLQTLNQSLEASPGPNYNPSERYHSIDYGSLHSPTDDSGSIYSDKRKRKQEADRQQILQKLSQKNQELRKQLKKISDELTQQLKHKKFVPKKKATTGDQDQDEKQRVANAAGIRRELQNGYKQIQMYKRTIAALTGKEEKQGSDVRVKRLENNIAAVDAQINQYVRRVEGLKKVTKVQDKVIEKDINEDLVGGVNNFRKEAEEMRNQLKQLQKRQRTREVNYKRQQAYLFEVQRKWREMNGDYFPELKKKQQQPLPPPVASRVKEKTPVSASAGISAKEYSQALEELLGLKNKHEEYHKKIDGLLQQKSKIVEEEGAVQENVKYSDRVIEALRLRLKEIRKIFRPTKKSLFGYDSHNEGNTELQSQYNGGVDEIQKEIQEQINQDQFDIKHLIANIPKPSRPKVVIQFEEKPNGKGAIERRPSIAREISGDKGGMIISGQKSQPKKWGSALTRIQQKGRGIRRESAFQDKGQWPADAKPLIIGVNIWVNKNNAIMGLQAIYLNDDQIRYGTKSSPAADGFLQRYDLQAPDALKNITGAFSHEGYLEYLVLYSRQGKVGTFGFKNEGQDPFTFGLSSTERPFRIFGASFVFDNEPRINRLGIEVCQET